MILLIFWVSSKIAPNGQG